MMRFKATLVTIGQLPKRVQTFFDSQDSAEKWADMILNGKPGLQDGVPRAPEGSIVLIEQSCWEQVSIVSQKAK